MKSLFSRLKRLERIERDLRPSRLIIQYGHMKELPRDYTGERHVVTLSRTPDASGQDFFEWEERPGPGPAAEADSQSDDIMRVCFVKEANWKLPGEIA